MSGIFGIWRRDGSPVPPSALETMRRAMAEWGPDGGNVLLSGPAGLGQMRLFSTPEARRERMPVESPLPTVAKGGVGGVVFTAAGRVDNREELIRQSGAGSQGAGLSDGELILHAYRKWGEESAVRIYGDWAFAAWHPQERRLLLARDHHGNTALYYHAGPRVLAFASSRKALLALNLAPMEMDELYLSQVLVSWPGYHGERTIHRPIRRLPPAHCLTVTPDRLDVRRYWRLEETPELRLPKREDYAEAFREVFDEAVRCRLRSSGEIAVTLSGGLDSGSVAATAAGLLRREGKPLIAFTSVPLSGTGPYVGQRFGDELPFARATARHAGIGELHPVTAAAVTPIQAIRRMLQVHDEPAHAAGNFFWMLGILQAAPAHGCRVLLTGQMGNAGISWEGSVFSQPLAFQLHHFGWWRWPKEAAKRYAPAALLKAYRNMRRPKDERWSSSAIHPDLALRLDLLDRMLDAPDSLFTPALNNPRGERFFMIKQGLSLGGAKWAENGAAHGLEVRDPTADARVLAFTLSVPDRIFMDPETGVDRWLIREAMKGRLPDEVRLNRKKGCQAGDLVPRLRACADEVETALDELAAGPAAAYVNVPYMREVWTMVRSDDTPEAFHKAVTILTRGIMAGLWVNGFYNF